MKYWGLSLPPARASLRKWWRSRWIAHSLWTWILGFFFLIMGSSIMQCKGIKCRRVKSSEGGGFSEDGGSRLTRPIATCVHTYLGYQNFCLYNPGRFFSYPYLTPSSPWPQVEKPCLTSVCSISLLPAAWPCLYLWLSTSSLFCSLNWMLHLLFFAL